MRNYREINEILIKSGNVHPDVHFSSKKQVIGSMIGVLNGACQKEDGSFDREKNLAFKPCKRGLCLLYDVVDEYEELLFEQTALMYFMGIIAASQPSSLTARTAYRILEILDIPFGFDGVFAVSPYGLAHSDCHNEEKHFPEIAKIRKESNERMRGKA